MSHRASPTSSSVMRQRGAHASWLLSALVGTLALGGCQSPKSGVAQPGDDAGRGADAGRDAGGSELPAELPGGYEPRISCGGLGKACGDASDCRNDLACTGFKCLPDVPEQTVACDPNTGCPEQAPLCVANVCMTVDQVGCLCLEPNSRGSTPQCRSITDNPGECTAEDGLCDANPESCCEGLTCLRGENSRGQQLLGLCKVACDGDGDCDSGCCTSIPAIAGKFCAPAAYCVNTCRTEKEECDADRNPCCEGLVCSTSTVDPALNGCQKSCTKDAQCDTGCCLLFEAPDGGLRDFGICAPSDRCP